MSPSCGTISNSPSASLKYRVRMDVVAQYKWIAMPWRCSTSPFAATVYTPSRKSTPDALRGSGSQRSRFGFATPPTGALWKVRLSMRWNGGCAAEGRIR